MNEKGRQLYELRDAAFTSESLRKYKRENAGFWENINRLREQCKNEISIYPFVYKHPFMGKYCIDVEIQCASEDTRKAAEQIRYIDYYLVPLQVNPSIGETCDLFARLPER